MFHVPPIQQLNREFQRVQKLPFDLLPVRKTKLNRFLFQCVLYVVLVDEHPKESNEICRLFRGK